MGAPPDANHPVCPNLREDMLLLKDGLWAISSYFNPVGYRSRRANYDVFRKNLNVRLLTVELGFRNSYELEGQDADVLVQVPSDNIMWQKERLLNLALERLPGSCIAVAWVDCDILLDIPDWPARAVDSLERDRLVQLFSQAHHLRRGAGGARRNSHDIMTSQKSLASLYGENLLPFRKVSRGEVLGFSPGHCWAMRRKDIETCGIYDAAILGGGDLLLFFAAVGRCGDVVSRYGMNDRQAAHYLEWAESFYPLVEGKVGCLEGEVRHLWHGERKHRRFGNRYQDMKEFDFDPSRDITVDRNGAWRWSSDKTGLHRYVENYFRERKEDGTDPDV